MTSRVRNCNELIKYSKKCKELKPMCVDIIEEVNLENNELFHFLGYKKNKLG